MRNSVLLAEIFILIPAILYFCRNLQSSKERQILLAAFLLYPGQILIDHGHFQYNNISLGLFILAVGCLLKDCILTGSVAFVFALSYKQMELYHSLPFFSYLLGLCLRSEKSWTSGLTKLVKIGTSVLLTFIALWWPFLPHLKQVLVRIFPLHRGLFEDKVANFWCSINVIMKLKDNYESDYLAMISAVTTLVLAIPPNLALFWRPDKNQFLTCLLNTSLVFFLFSYQVHEKSILLAAFPALMVFKINGNGRFSNLMLTWFLLVTNFSMWPLLQKEGLEIAFVGLQTIFVTFAHYYGFLDFQDDLSKSAKKKRASPKPMTSTDLMKNTFLDWFIWTLFNFSLVGFIVILSASVYVEPPPKYPHLWPLIISVYSAGHFLAFLAYFMWYQCGLFVQSGCSVTQEKKNK